MAHGHTTLAGAARFALRVPLLCLTLSCARPGPENAASAPPPAGPEVPPLAVLRAGEHPLWFTFSENGPEILASIEDARFSSALVPWPLAPHIRYILASGDALLLAVNREGFLRLAPWGGTEAGSGGVALFQSAGGAYWRRYTLGAFALLEGKPAALLYRDDRFLDSGAELPRTRVWTFGPESAAPAGLDVPALDRFPAAEGWNADALRLAPDGFWYYRVTGTADPERPETRLFRGADLEHAGEEISISAFQNSALPEPLRAAPAPLERLLNAALPVIAGASVLVTSPEFPAQRVFAGNDPAAPGLSAYYRGGGTGHLAVVILPGGGGLYLTLNNAAEPVARPITLPPLPEGFVYTGVGLVNSGGDAAGETLFAAWEEQEDFSTGAAGFMVLQSPVTEP